MIKEWKYFAEIKKGVWSSANKKSGCNNFCGRPRAGTGTTVVYPRINGIPRP